MKKDNRTATTVKLKEDLYYNFRVEAMRHKMSLQEFVEKCVNLYVSNEPHSASFREIVNQYIVPVLSTTGSFGSKP